ncbi:uncharacterized protein LOC132264785 isoform X2 [Phlebotomus argentipes]|nr:uncharacterized protein LOC132264785 isoform X2 [Phlebotomus argentipes]
MSKRRESAPVLNDNHEQRTEQYRQAMQDFTDWRKENCNSQKSNMNSLFAKGSSSIGDKSSPTYAEIDDRIPEEGNTPPEGFFRSNSIPNLAPSPHKSSAMPQKKPQKARSHRKGRAPPPPPRFNANAPLPAQPKPKKSSAVPKNCLQPMESEKDGEDTDGTRFSGNYRRFDVDSDAGIKLSAPKKYPRRLNVVPKPAAMNAAEYDEVINEGFRFLNEHCQNLDITLDEYLKRNNVPVTDLDKSDGDSSDEQRKDSLSSFGGLQQQTIDTSVLDPFYNRIQDFMRMQTVTMCMANEVHRRVPAPGSTLLTPLEFSAGEFRKSSVSVRKYSLGEGEDYGAADVACKRDYEILANVRHEHVSVLMAVVMDRELNQINVMMEPFTCSLNHYLYKENKEFSVDETITIVQQLSSAVQYLHESEYIHSNISSHTVMMRLSPRDYGAKTRRYPVCVKLMCFELATSVKYDIKKKLEQTYGRQGYFNGVDGFTVMGKTRTLPPMSDTVDKEKYLAMSRDLHRGKIVPTVRATKMDFIDPAHMPYSQAYRQTFSLHYYQAPELVKSRALFVVPRKECDIYSLSVLLWEMLNKCVPYVMYTYDELETIHAAGRSQIPIIDDERCRFFDEVFSLGLASRTKDRIISPPHFDSLLEDVRFMHQKRIEKEQMENDDIQRSQHMKNITNAERNDKVQKKDYHLARIEDILDNVTLESANHSVFFERAESCKDELLDGNFKERKNQRTNGELSLSIASVGKSAGSSLMDSARKKRSMLYSQLYEEKPNDTFFNLSQSTIFNSNADFHNKLLETAKEGDKLERTSTTKKKKPREIGNAKDLFGGDNEVKSRRNLNEKIEFAANESSTKDDSLKNVSMNSGFVERAKARLEKCILNGSTNVSSEEEIDAVKKTFSPSKYSFNVGQCDLPKTNIARRNKLRRYAWLSEKKPSISPGGSSFNFLSDESGQNAALQGFNFTNPMQKKAEEEKAFQADVAVDERRGSTCSISLNDSFRERKVNVNLKVKHNDQEIFSNSFTSEEDLQAFMTKKISQIHVDLFKNNGNDQAEVASLNPKMEIKMIGHRGEESCEIQREILDLSAQIVEKFGNHNNSTLDETQEKSSFERDCRRMMIVRPDTLQAAIRKQRRATKEDLERFENSLWRREKSFCERTSYNGSLGESDGEDAENCAALANKKGTKSGSEDSKHETEDLYIDDDLSHWPALCVNVDLDFLKKPQA